MKIREAFTMDIHVASPLDIGQTAKGARKVISILGGTIKGKDVDGTILPGGADYQLIRSDGIAEIEAFCTLMMSDGTLIYMKNHGYRHGSKEVLSRIAQGEIVSSDEYYFRTTPTFEVENEKYSWLNRTIFVGKGEKTPNSVRITFYEIC